VILGITGANSVIGRGLTTAALSAGHTVRGFVRNPGSVDELKFELGRPLDESALQGLDAMIHLAWDRSRPDSQSLQRNLEGSYLLAEQCNNAGIYPLLLSTMSVYSQGQSDYGRAKSELEETFVGNGGSFVRAGLVWGGELTPIVKTVVRLAQLPLFCVHLSPNPALYHSEQSSLCEQIIQMCQFRQTISTGADAVSSEPISLMEMQHAVGGSGMRLHIRVRTKLLVSAGGILERLSVPLPFRVDSLASVALQESGGETVSGVSGKSAPSFAGKQEFLQWLCDVAERG
jgi:hypothetical protein